MAESDKKTDNNSSTSGNNDGDAAPVDTSNDSEQLKPPPIPASAKAGATDAQASSDSQKTSQRSRELGAETKQAKQQEKEPEKSVFERVNELMKQLTPYQLKPEMLAEVAHGITGQVMAGIHVGIAALDSVVQKVDPIAHAGKHLRDALGINSVATNIAPESSGRLPSQPVGVAQTSIGATIQVS